LLTGAGPVFPLARRLFLNENTTTTSDPQETAFYNWLYASGSATTSHKVAFESFLTGQGFFTCDDSTPLGCGNAGPTNGCNLNDGRGVGAAKSNARCTR